MCTTPHAAYSLGFNNLAHNEISSWPHWHGADFSRTALRMQLFKSAVKRAGALRIERTAFAKRLRNHTRRIGDCPPSE